MVQVLSICILLIAANGLYVAAEFAAVTVRRSRVQQAAESGSKAARRLLPILEDPKALDSFIAACQVGITLSSLVLGAYGQASLSDVLIPFFSGMGGLQLAAAESASALAILVTLTAFQMVIGELVPKSLALQNPTAVSLATILPMELSLRVLAPLIWVLNGSGWAILRWMGMSPAGHHHLHSPEEIRYLVAESRKGGLLEPEEQRRLDQALALGARRVRQLMVPRTEMEALPAGTPVREALELVRPLPYTRYPVYRDSIDGVLGYLHTRDLSLALLGGRGDTPVEALARPILGVPEELSADRLLARMRESRAVMALVVDEYGGVSGLVTIHDLLTELLGDVADEHWPDEPGPERLPDGRILLLGRTSVHDAAEWTALRWSGASDTVNGIVTELLGRIPVPGDTVLVDGATVMVEAVEGTVATRILVTPILPASAKDEA